MSKKTNKKDKGIIIGICMAVVAVIAAVIAVVVSVVNGGVSANEFVTTDTRYVIEYPTEFFTEDQKKEVYMPNRIFVVYTHDGDTVTGKIVYYEYDDVAAANEAIEPLKENMIEDAYTDMVVKGKYIIFKAADIILEGKTMADAESEKEFVESMKQMYEETVVEDETTEDDGTVVEETTVEETTTEEN